jgi:hypothetical protein
MTTEESVTITIEITKEELDALNDLSLPTARVVALTDRINDEYWETIEWQKAEQRLAQRAEDDQ